MKSEELIQNLVADLEPVKPLSSVPRRLAAWTATALLSVVAGVALIGLRSDLHAVVHGEMFMLETLLIAFAAVFSAASAFVLSVPRSERQMRHKLMALAPVMFWIMYLVFEQLSGGVRSEDVIPMAAGCAGKVGIFGIVPGIVIFFMIRQAAPTDLGWSGFLASVAVLSVGCMTLQFVCPDYGALHVLLWHALPILVLGLGGIFLGKWILRW